MNHKDLNHSVLFTPNADIQKNEKKVFIVIVITLVMMVAEIIAGTITGSMSLLADGWHMASHAGALSIAFLAYRLARSEKINSLLTFGAGKVIPLGGYTSAVALALVALFMIYESIERLLAPIAINYQEALWVAVIGLVVNLICAFLLMDQDHGHSHGHDHDHHHDHKHDHHDHGATCSHGAKPVEKVHDHNLRSAYMHVLADAVTSVAAIVALLLGYWRGLNFLDPLIGIVASFVICKWAWNLMRETAAELLDVHSKSLSSSTLETFLKNLGAEVLDIHVWRVAPHALACEIVLSSPKEKDTLFFREAILKKFSIQHLVVEVRNF